MLLSFPALEVYRILASEVSLTVHNEPVVHRRVILTSNVANSPGGVVLPKSWPLTDSIIYSLNFREVLPHIARFCDLIGNIDLRLEELSLEGS